MVLLLAPLPDRTAAWPLTASARVPERLLTAAAVALPAAAAIAMRAAAAPRTLRARGTLVAAWLLRALVAFCLVRAARRLQLHERSLVNETVAAVPGSRFLALGQPFCGGGVPNPSLHFLSEAIAGAPSAASQPPVLLHLSHGFGANSLTWAPLIASLAESHPRRERPVAARPLLALASDRIGFGLSSRPRELWSYSAPVAAQHAAELLGSMAAETLAAQGGASSPGFKYVAL